VQFHSVAAALECLAEENGESAEGLLTPGTARNWWVAKLGVRASVHSPQTRGWGGDRSSDPERDDRSPLLTIADVPDTGAADESAPEPLAFTLRPSSPSLLRIRNQQIESFRFLQALHGADRETRGPIETRGQSFCPLSPDARMGRRQKL